MNSLEELKKKVDQAANITIDRPAEEWDILMVSSAFAKECIDRATLAERERIQSVFPEHTPEWNIVQFATAGWRPKGCTCPSYSEAVSSCRVHPVISQAEIDAEVRGATAIEKGEEVL